MQTPEPPVLVTPSSVNPWLFFGWRQGALAFADILMLLALIVATMVSFATALNFSVWQRNPLLL